MNNIKHIASDKQKLPYRAFIFVLNVFFLLGGIVAREQENECLEQRNKVYSKKYSI